MQSEVDEHRLLSPDAFLTRERSHTLRHEYVEGVSFLKEGGSGRHNIICGNFCVALSKYLSDSWVAFMVDMRLRVELPRGVAFCYPDSMACCGSRDQSLDWVDNPLVLAEVLSQSTERLDRGEKFNAYIQIPTLQEYVLIEQAAKHVELFRRAKGWQREVLAAGDRLLFDSIAFAMAVDALYRRVEF